MNEACQSVGKFFETKKLSGGRTLFRVPRVVSLTF